MRGDPPVPLNYERIIFLFPIRKMAAQGEQGQGGVEIVLIESMVQDDSTMQVDHPPRVVSSTDQMLEVMGQSMEDMNEMRANAQNMGGRMEFMGRFVESMNARVDVMNADRQAWRENKRTMDCKMAAPRDRTNEPTRGIVDGVGPAMEMEKLKEVEVARDAVITNGETEACRVRHEETTEIIKEITEKTKTTEAETREIEGELKETKDEHTHTHGVSEGQ